MTLAATSNCAIDFDSLPQWGPSVTAVVNGISGQALVDELAQTNPEYIEDARDWVVNRIGREKVLDAIVLGMRDRFVRLYHGSRLAAAEFTSVQNHGLRPLNLRERRSALVNALSAHPRWSEVEERLDDTLLHFGQQGQAGRREDGFVHACFSRSGLLHGCNHYLKHGAEVDGHIAHFLFGDDSGDIYLRNHRRPYIIAFDVPFDVAAQGSHSHGDLAVGRELLALRLLGYWAYGNAHPAFRVDKQQDCTAVKINGGVRPDRLVAEAVDEGQIKNH